MAGKLDQASHDSHLPCWIKKEAIKAAFDERMKLQSGKAPKEQSADQVVLQQRITRLEKELVEKSEQLEQVQELLSRFRHNAKLMGLPAERLEAPIAPLTAGDRQTS